MFSVEIKDEAVTAALTRAAAQMDDMTPLFWDIGEILVDSTIERFGAGTAPDGSTWAPKSQTTLDVYKRRKEKVSSKPLFGPSGMLSRQIFYSAEADQVQIVSNRPYAAMMQFGGSKAKFPHLWGDIPARPFLGISEEDSAAIAGQIAEYMSGAFA